MQMRLATQRLSTKLFEYIIFALMQITDSANALTRCVFEHIIFALMQISQSVTTQPYHSTAHS